MKTFTLKASIRCFLADTFVMLTFATAHSMIVEIFISGLAVQQSLQARLMSVPINLVTARPYGMFRDWIVRVMHARERGLWRIFLADITAFACFNVPVYILILLSTGAFWNKIFVAASTLTVTAAFLGGPYGAYLDLIRRWFGMKTQVIPEGVGASVCTPPSEEDNKKPTSC
ncbi:MAG: L-alanine exporter AlaE [bacterium]|nr:L-alanine exporter AlaE [bacterium]